MLSGEDGEAADGQRSGSQPSYCFRVANASYNFLRLRCARFANVR